MRIKTLNGEKEISSLEGLENIGEEFKRVRGIWVKWEDIKPILEEYQSAIENESLGCSDYGLMKGDNYDDRI